jgi:hypothetical protein
VQIERNNTLSSQSGMTTFDFVLPDLRLMRVASTKGDTISNYKYDIYSIITTPQFYVTVPRSSELDPLRYLTQDDSLSSFSTTRFVVRTSSDPPAVVLQFVSPDGQKLSVQASPKGSLHSTFLNGIKTVFPEAARLILNGRDLDISLTAVDVGISTADLITFAPDLRPEFVFTCGETRFPVKCSPDVTLLDAATATCALAAAGSSFVFEIAGTLIKPPGATVGSYQTKLFNVLPVRDEMFGFVNVLGQKLQVTVRTTARASDAVDAICWLTSRMRRPSTCCTTGSLWRMIVNCVCLRASGSRRHLSRSPRGDTKSSA